MPGRPAPYSQPRHPPARHPPARHPPARNPPPRPPAPPAPPSPGSGAPVDPAAIAAAGPRPSPEDLLPPLPAEISAEPGQPDDSAPPQQRQAVLVGYGVKLAATTRRPRKAAAAGFRWGKDSSGSVPAAEPSSGWSADTPGGLAKPPVRKLARDLGIDLAGLSGTGPAGSITREDVQAVALGATGPAVPRDAAAALPREERIAIRGVRKHTAAAVTASAFTAPHATEFLQVDVEATMQAAVQVADLPEFAGIR